MRLHKGLIITSALAIAESLTSGAVVSGSYIVEIDPEKHQEGDIIEIACLPADHRLVDATLVCTGDIGGSVNIGLLTGDFAAEDVTREIDDLSLIFEDETLEPIVQRMSLPGAFFLSSSDRSQGIGLHLVKPPTAKGVVSFVINYTS